MIPRRLTSACVAVLVLACIPTTPAAATSGGAAMSGVAAMSGGAATSAVVTQSPGPSGSPTSALGGPVLVPVGAGGQPPPSGAGLGRALLPLLRGGNLGPSVGIVVVDATTGDVLYDRNGGRGLTPASTTKLLTAAAVLAATGPDTRLVTRVVAAAAPAGSAAPATPGPAAATPPAGAPATPGPASLRSIVLVGGGDPTLTALPSTAPVLAGYPSEASLSLLAARTARALRREGVRQVRLTYDDRLFTGRATAASWRPAYVRRDVGPVTALSVDQGRVRRPGSARVRDPAAEAARRFAQLLGRGGVVVSGLVRRGPAPPRPATLAAVASPPVAALVEHMLEASDNDVAEALARHAALATGTPASFDGAARAVVASVARLGLPTESVLLYDGSGLSRANRIPARTLAQLLRLSASGQHPELQSVLTGLPVAGFTGTLGKRFVRGPAVSGSGLVRGKTGTLTGVTSLAGVVPDRNGRLLAYAFVADRVPVARTLAVRDAMDRMAAVLAQCGCR